MPLKEVANVVLLNQMKLDNSTFLGQTINSAILNSGATTTVCRKKWLDCFLETSSKKEKKIPSQVGTKTFKFGDGMKLKSLKTVISLCVIAKIDIKKSDVVDADIPLLLSKKAMKRAHTSLNFNDDTVEMFGKKLNCCVPHPTITIFPYRDLHRIRLSSDTFYI